MLPLILHGVEPWLSSESIERGKQWAVQLTSSLMESNFGIVCLTPESMSQPFVLFEAGALAKNVKDSHVCTYLLGLKPEEVEYPLAAFQATRASRAETLALVKQINDLLPEGHQKESTFTARFEAFWPKLEKTISTALALACPQQSHRSFESQPILEEIRQSVRSLCDESKILHVLSGPTSNVTANRVKVTSLPLGSLVRHPQLGLGRILEIVPVGGILRIKVYFYSKGEKMLAASITHLEPVEEPMPDEVRI